jgi:CRP-like cAMP-binding protein
MPGRPGARRHCLATNAHSRFHREDRGLGRRDDEGNPMTPAHDAAAWQEKLAALPLLRHGAGETVIAQGTKTGRLLILKSGAVSVVKGGTEIAKVTEAGAIFGELSALLDLPHTADVRTAAASEFHVADAALLLADPATLLYVTTVLARRVDAANRALVDLKAEIKAGAPPAAIEQKVGRIEALLSSIGTGFIRAGVGYAGYPFP